MIPNDQLYEWGGFGLIVLSLAIVGFFVVGDAEGPVMRWWARYCAFIERKLRLMFIWTRGRTIAGGQLAALLLLLMLHAAFGVPGWLAWLVLIVFAPPMYIEQKRHKRVEAIEEQLDNFLMALANALKATPSIGNAFISIQTLLPSPIKEEVELATKEMRVGSTLDQALLNMAGRVGSRQLDSTLSAILIGRQIGGDLPRILETTAATLREMARLENVVRSKTAEAKAQLWVLAVFPFGLVLCINWVSPGYFDLLGSTVVGWVIAGLAGICWLLSLLVARKVLAVKI